MRDDRKHHIDTNHHVNNAQYVEIAREVLPSESRSENSGWNIRKQPSAAMWFIRMSAGRMKDTRFLSVTSREPLMQ